MPVRDSSRWPRILMAGLVVTALSAGSGFVVDDRQHIITNAHVVAGGEVIGVNTAIARLEGGGNIGIGFAIPIDRAKATADRLIQGS